ncbi:zinc-dependent metalloprotease [Flavobacterium cerinum]|uniref:M12 family metallo-peptidase n=1 Tax=Flavobacterium cerinum TaxID=2502784 RepID=A0ABY5IUS3_9FLAO|nr:zinc-dependent metalloprotease family protein [Flavobacterium cerinum]UUC46572.1 M12 family metallo-peptidase [Flavobacterium cerinum]
MKRKILLSFASVFAMSVGYAQNGQLWTSAKQERVVISKKAQRESFPTNYSLYNLDFSSLKAELSKAPSRFSNNSDVIITIPNAEGKIEKFKIYEASNFAPELQLQFPDIRSYVGIGIDDQYAQLRLSISPEGIQTMVFRADKKAEFIEPFSADAKTYAVYSSAREKGKLPFNCSTPHEQELSNDLTNKVSSAQQLSNTGQLKTMRLALSCTGEYTTYHGGTVAGALAAMNNTMTRVNGVFEKDLAIHLNIIANNSAVIFTNAATDPYSDAEAGADGAWNSELQNTLTNVIGNAAYDIGHLFGATGGGGNAGCIGCVCVDNSKGSGYTSPADGVPMGDTFDIDYVAHEMGHQLGANHTFSHNIEGSGVNVEPGSGSSIMGYAGITNYNVQQHSDDYFTYRSILQIQTNMATKSCPVTTPTGNQAPVINAGSNYTIPKGTAFVLKGTGSDPDGNPITYNWEQNDSATSANTGANSVASPTKTTGPNFRSVAPSASPVRYMPAFSTVLQNTLSSTWESVTDVARTFNFTLTGRDNVANVGQTNTSSMAVTVSGTAGPFKISSPANDNISWTQGTSQTITWDVAGTTANNINTANVNILFSSDNGATFTTLVANTPNDGSEVITVPNVTSPNCRIKVEAVGNIFYALSKNIAVGYTITTTCNTYTANPNTTIAAQNPIAWQIMGSVNVPDNVTISDLNLNVNITHTRINDLYIGLLKPGATTVGEIRIVYQQGCSTLFSNMNTTFDDSGANLSCAGINNPANSYKPLNTLDIFNGQSSAGAWRLVIADVAAANNGVLNSFGVNICSKTVTLGNESFNLQDFNIYPNPNNGNFNVEFKSSSNNEIKVVVHDIRGREIFNKSYQNSGLFNQNLQLSNVQSGIYLVTVQDGDRKEVRKIVIE